MGNGFNQTQQAHGMSDSAGHPGRLRLGTPRVEGNANPNIIPFGEMASLQKPTTELMKPQARILAPSFSDTVSYDANNDTSFGGSFSNQSESQDTSSKWNYGGNDAMAAGKSLVNGASSGNFSGMGAGLGGAVGTLGGPEGSAIGSGVGAVAGGVIDYFLAESAKKEAEKKARKEEQKKQRWQKYQLSLEERGRNLENEQLQYGRDDAAMQRMLAAQGEMLKTKNAILQSGNLYRARKGRNWYGNQGLQAQVRGGSVPQSTTAQDLGYTGKTAEQTKLSAPMGMGY